MNALARLGMVSETPSDVQTFSPARVTEEERTDYFVQRDGMTFAGTHLLIDVWDARNLDDPAHVDAALRAAATIAGAVNAIRGCRSRFCRRLSRPGGSTSTNSVADASPEIGRRPSGRHPLRGIGACRCSR